MARNPEDLGAVIVESIRDLVDGADTDLKTFGEEIAKDAILAAASGDDAMLAHTQAQVKLLTEHHRIRTNELSRAILERVVATSVRLMIAAVAIVVMVMPMGCTPPGTLLASNVKPAVDLVTDGYDQMLRGELDPKMLGATTDVQAEARRATMLRTSALLRRTVDEAVGKE